MTTATIGVLCPRCTYVASGLRDLDAHGSMAHAGEDEQPEPVGRLFGIIAEATPAPDAPPMHPSLTAPQADPTFWIAPAVAPFLNAVAERSRRGQIVNVSLVGPTGSGKSSLPREFAAAWHRPFFTMHCQLITEQTDWWGSKELSVATGTYVRHTPLVDALETPGSIILLDEANRTNPENLNALFGLLDDRRRAWVPVLQREVVVAPGVVFFITLNEGGEYVGTNAVDRALRDRVTSTVALDYLPPDVERSLLCTRTGVTALAATRLVEFATTVRRNPKRPFAVSTRQLLECASLVHAGLLVRDAVGFAIANSALDVSERSALLQALQLTTRPGETGYARQRHDD